MGNIVVIDARTLGEGWLAVSRAILEEGALATYDGQVTRELAHVSAAIADPSPDDAVIARLGDPRGWTGCTRTSSTARTSRSWATPRATRYASST